jgi:hypothetical protein
MIAITTSSSTSVNAALALMPAVVLTPSRTVFRIRLMKALRRVDATGTVRSTFAIHAGRC